MKIIANSPEEYLSLLPADKKEAFIKIRETIVACIPTGFQECIIYDMIGYVVPKTIYPPGYHCDPKLSLPFLNIGVQKNFIGFYHFGIYADENLMLWFKTEFLKYNYSKLDIGKSCIRFKNINQIPYDLLGRLVARITPEEWINLYEKEIKR